VLGKADGMRAEKDLTKSESTENNFCRGAETRMNAGDFGY
jgi:hypothetical protein